MDQPDTKPVVSLTPEATTPLPTPQVRITPVIPSEVIEKSKAIAAEKKDILLIPPSVEATIQGITKKYGKGTIFAGLEGTNIAGVEWYPTGSITLDTLLGGGLGRGRIVEVYGPESVGKSTLALHFIAATQKAFPDKACAFIDAEHALDRDYAEALEVDLKKLLLSQPDYGEQALEIVDMLVRSNGCSIIVVDSVAALVPKAELEGEIGQSHMGLQARLMSQALRKLTGIIKKSNTTVVFINQLRSKIGIMFGNPEVTTGGNALKFYASQRIDIRRVGAIKNGDVVIGNKTKIKITKNKLAPPFRVAEVTLSYGKGINKEGELADLGIKYGIIEKSGAWFSYNEERWHGKLSVMESLEKNKGLSDKIEGEIRTYIKKEGNVL